MEKVKFSHRLEIGWVLIESLVEDQLREMDSLVLLHIRAVSDAPKVDPCELQRASRAPTEHRPEHAKTKDDGNGEVFVDSSAS